MIKNWKKSSTGNKEDKSYWMWRWWKQYNFYIIWMGIEGPQLIAVNTDVRHLLITKAHRKILVGKQLTKGLGAGKDPKVGARSRKRI
ncbi:hypothetical protein [Candidatus Nanopusillus massiliensis]|uniref:hypothetical protein n=1 Tax=Candidatus Nanopusillus massiliensis TaxID=2897163 RepID=UPI001E63C025|nr:hypothetical protein [Candidatus Nanopusillus massiliensis]